MLVYRRWMTGVSSVTTTLSVEYVGARKAAANPSYPELGDVGVSKADDRRQTMFRFYS